MNIGVTVRVTRNIVAAVSAVTISASAVDQSISAQAAVATDINYSTFIVPIYPLAEDQVSVGDGEGIALAFTKEVDVFKIEEALPEDSDPVFDADKVLADSVTVTESTFKIFTNPVDFDPSDDDVDPTPVTIAESDAKDIIVGELADSDLAGSPGLIGFTAYGDAQLSTAVKKYGSASLKLDGTGDYVLSDDTLDYGSNPFTVEMWVYPTSGTQDDVIFDSRVAYNDDNIMLRQSGSFLVAIRGNGILKSQNNVFSANTWTHLAVTRGGTFGNTYTIFVDGAVIHTATSGGTPAAAELRIGADFNNLNGWAGYVDGFALSTSDKYGGQSFTPASPVAVDPTTPIVLTFDGANGFTTIDNTGIPETVDVYVTESIANNPEVLKTDAVTTAEAIDDFDIGKNPSDTATTSEAIDRFDVTTEFDDTVTATEELAKNFEFTETSNDSVTVVQSSLKTFNSSVDFDPSDDDVDPDPIIPSDAINEFDFNKGLTDTASATESSAKSVTVGDIADNDDATVTEAIANNPEIPKTDSVTAVEGIKNNPELVKSDTASATDAITKFDARPAFSDSITAPTDAIDDFDIQLAKSDTVNVSDVSVKNFTENVDFDRSDADADADPVTVTETLGFNATHPLSDSFSPSDAAPVFTFTNVYTDTATATESINTTLVLGESEYVYPDIVYMSDGEEGFVQDRFRFTRLDYTAQVNSGDMLLNSAVMWGGATDDLARASFTGVIGYDGFIGQVVMNSDTITYPDTSNAGLVVNFLYTDVDEDDRALGGYYFNQTPINAGNSVVGARTIL